MKQISRKPTKIKEPPFIQCCFTNLILYFMIVFGVVREKLNFELCFKKKENNRDGYIPLFSFADKFFTNHFYPRIWDCIMNVTSSLSCDICTVVRRKRTANGIKLTKNTVECINLASFNYLGLSQNSGRSVDAVEKSIKTVGLVTANRYRELGRTKLHDQVEKLTADFLGTEAVISFGMGFATNVMNLPSIITSGCLVLSDQRNHSSMILGLKLTQATVRVFKHNDMDDLEEKLEKGIIEGQPGQKNPWKKIFIVTEGIFSMEGSIVNLPEIIALKRKYKAYLYIDEAHSIGVLGHEGKGVTQHFGIDIKEIDILMGTYSKSFATMGGFIAGSGQLINFLRKNSQGSCYSSPLPMVVIPKLIHSLKMCLGIFDNKAEIQSRISQLRRSTHYLRGKLCQMGIVVSGDPDSPIIPLIFYSMSKTLESYRILRQKYGIAVALVGFPAVSVFESRMRICLSADHTKEQIDHILYAIRKVTGQMALNYDTSAKNMKEVLY